MILRIILAAIQILMILFLCAWGYLIMEVVPERSYLKNNIELLSTNWANVQYSGSTYDEPYRSAE